MSRLAALLATTAPLLASTAIASSPAAAALAASSARTSAAAIAAAHSGSKAQARGRSARARRATRRCRRNGVARHGKARNCRSARNHGHTRMRPLASRKKRPVIPDETAQSKAVTIASVLATPCQNSRLIPDAGNLPLVRAAVLCLINTARAKNGEDPLSADPQLEQAAASHGQEMIARNYFEHISPSGLTPVERVRGTGYIPDSEAGYAIGENLAWGTLSLASPQAIVSAWLASPEHLANILESSYEDTGIDVEAEVPPALAEGAPGALYTQEFGVIVR